MAKILVLNGPNLNLLGQREPEIYGSDSLDDVMTRLKVTAGELSVHLSCSQTNSEGDLIDLVHGAKAAEIDFILINPGALTHTSIGLRDALLGVAIPFIEVHLSNVFARESFRHHSYLSDVAVGCVVGLGTQGYELALLAAIQHTESK
jgi:3-dehydroquinate dehydratase-2